MLKYCVERQIRRRFNNCTNILCTAQRDDITDRKGMYALVCVNVDLHTTELYVCCSQNSLSFCPLFAVFLNISYAMHHVRHDTYNADTGDWNLQSPFQRKSGFSPFIWNFFSRLLTAIEMQLQGRRQGVGRSILSQVTPDGLKLPRSACSSGLDWTAYCPSVFHLSESGMETRSGTTEFIAQTCTPKTLSSSS